VSELGICEHCASKDVRWFTPERYAERAAILLCLRCEKLTIRSAWRDEVRLIQKRAA
jgi:hypothetical protein